MLICAISWKQVWWKLLKMDQKDFSLKSLKSSNNLDCILNDLKYNQTGTEINEF